MTLERNTYSVHTVDTISPIVIYASRAVRKHVTICHDACCRGRDDTSKNVAVNSEQCVSIRRVVMVNPFSVWINNNNEQCLQKVDVLVAHIYISLAFAWSDARQRSFLAHVPLNCMMRLFVYAFHCISHAIDSQKQIQKFTKKKFDNRANIRHVNVYVERERERMKYEATEGFFYILQNRNVATSSLTYFVENLYTQTYSNGLFPLWLPA